MGQLADDRPVSFGSIANRSPKREVYLAPGRTVSLRSGLDSFGRIINSHLQLDWAAAKVASAAPGIGRQPTIGFKLSACSAVSLRTSGRT